jgi:hypothetical protein
VSFSWYSGLKIPPLLSFLCNLFISDTESDGSSLVKLVDLLSGLVEIFRPIFVMY